MNRLLAVLAIGSLLTTVQASDLSSAANDFIDAHDKLVKSRQEVAAGRAEMAANINDQEKLEDTVAEWFNDRADAARFAVEKADARKDLLEASDFSGPKAAKPTKPTKNLQQDAQSFITNYDKWVQLNATVEQNIEQIRSGTNVNSDIAIRDAATDFFTNRRLRHAAKKQWQSDLRSIKKLLKFKGTATASKPTGDSLKEHTQEFLNDRAEWEALGTLIQADLNNVRATINSSSLEASLQTLLTDRNRRAAKAKEMAFDRKAMRARNGGKSIASTFKDIFAANSPNDDDVDEDDPELEQSADHL